MNPIIEEEKLQLISAEHSKQIHWRESIKLEKKELDLLVNSIEEMEKKSFQEAEKRDQQIRKAKRDLEVSKEKAHLRGCVDEMVNNTLAGDRSLSPVVKTLAEFLGKKKKERKKKKCIYRISLLIHRPNCCHQKKLEKEHRYCGGDLLRRESNSR